MWLILLEALGVLLLGIFIVWWTMFSGRRGGERRAETSAPPAEGVKGDLGPAKDAEPPAR